MLQITEALTAGATFLLAFLIFTNPRGVNKKANFWLGIFISSLAIQSLDTLFVNHKIYSNYPHFIGITDITFFLIPPSIYFATLYFVSPQRPYKRTDPLHFFFLITYLLLNIPSLFFLNAAAKLQGKLNDNQGGTGYQIVLILILSYLFFYFILSLAKLNQHQKNVEQILSSGDEVNLKWLKYFLISILISAILWVIYIVFQGAWLNLLATSTYFAVILLLSYYSLHQVEVYNFNSHEKQDIQVLIEETETGAYAKKLQIDPKQLEELTQKLIVVMQTQKPFLDNDLNLLKLAGMLDITIHLLSYVINEGFQENFAQFVNRYRVEEAKKLLENTNLLHLTMLGIAFEAGFNSKTAFNTTFKKITGLSPSEYRASRSKL